MISRKDFFINFEENNEMENYFSHGTQNQFDNLTKNQDKIKFIKYFKELVLIKIEKSSDFWSLYDELCDDQSVFLCNRDFILDAFKDGRLFGLKLKENDKLLKKNLFKEGIFCNSFLSDCTLFLLPCFCIANNNKADIIWTHTRARRLGFGKKMVKELNIQTISNPLPESIKFWRSCGIIK